MTTRLYLVRHGDAGDRSVWGGDDRLRPLSRQGVRQAMAICEDLASRGIERLVSSPSLRCLETFEPLVTKVGLPLESDPRAGEGSFHEDVWAFFQELLAGKQAVAVCSHRDVIPELLTGLQRLGTRFDHELTWPKASIWTITGDGTSWTGAEYIPPRV